MNVELTSIQEESLKKELRKEIIGEIKKEKTLVYYIIRIVWSAFVAAFVFLLVWGMDSLVNIDTSPEHDNYINCWVEDEIGTDSETGAVMEKHTSIDCDRFVKN